MNDKFSGDCMMKLYMNTVGKAILLALFGSGFALPAMAAEVRVSLSQRETYVGLPVMLQIQVDNASKVEAPTIPQTDGLDVKSIGTPGRSTQITTINGRTTTRSSLTYRYEITPQRSGNFQIASITVHADGQAQQTKPIDFVASKSETGDLIFVEVAGKQNDIYVGQSLDVTLKIWLRPFRDSERNLTLSESDMWRLVSDRTNWGPFADRVQQLADARQRPAGREVLRKDRAGVEHSYYLYEIDATIYPQRPGKIEASDVKVVVNYPTALGKARDPFAGFFDDMPFGGGRDSVFGEDGPFSSPFGSRLTVESVRPIVAEAAVEPMNVLPVPAEGRPADYRGAVGKYTIATEATPTTVKAGDQINLLIGVSGTGPMDLLQAPPLAELPELTTEFKVPSEPLAGFVKDDRKVFSTTIRPRKEGIAHVPAIPLSYFDPAAKKFVTVYSDPISLHVEPAETLTLDAVVERNANAAVKQQANTSAKSSAMSPTLTLFSGDTVLRMENPARLSPTQLLWFLVTPPLLVLVLVVAIAWQRLSAESGLFSSSVRRSLHRINVAESAADVAEALRAFLTKHLRLNGSSVDIENMVGALRTAGYRALAVRYERLLQECARETPGVRDQSDLKELKKQALEAVHDLQAESQRPRPKTVAGVSRPSRRKNISRLQSTTLAMLLATSVIVTMLVSEQRVFAVDIASLSHGAAADRSVALTEEQQKLLLSEANDHYIKAQSAAAKDSADAKQAFADAAEKYEVLIQSGVRNSRLFANLGNAYLQTGQTGLAIANYRRSLHIDPTNRIAAANLSFAERSLNVPATSNSPTAVGSAVSNESVAALLSYPINWLNRRVHPRAISWIMILAWITLWAAIGLRVLGIRWPWKSMAGASLVVFAVGTASCVMSWHEATRDIAVVVTSDAVLHQGDGPDFPESLQGHLQEGQTVELCKRRGEWLQVRNGDGQVGWLPTSAVEAI